MTDWYISHVATGKAVTAATNANPCQVTIPSHGFTDGWKVQFQNVGGMTQLNTGFTYTVTVVDGDNITIGVNSSAYGVYTSGGTAHTGRSWSMACTSAARFSQLAVVLGGDTVYVGHDHVCPYTHTANLTFPSANTGQTPVRFISATTGSTPPTYQKSSTNQVDTTESSSYAIVFEGRNEYWGMQFTPGSHIDPKGFFNDCTFVLPASRYIAAGNQYYDAYPCVMTGCTLQFSDVSNTSIGVWDLSASTAISTPVEIKNLSFVNAGYRTWYVFVTGNTDKTCPVYISGCDFSGFNNATLCELLQVGTSQYMDFRMENCKTAATYAYTESAFCRCKGSQIEFVNVGPTDNPTNYYRATYWGSLLGGSTIYRSGGAQIEGTPTAWLVKTADEVKNTVAFFTNWIYGEAASTGSKTFTVHITNDIADLKDTEVWLELQYMGTSDSPLYTLTRGFPADPLSTGTLLTDDTTSTWNGSGPAFTYKQKVSVTAVIGETGLYRVRVGVSRPTIGSSWYFYIDPKIVVTS